jgi:superoxide dismutase, Fe-Mn family
MSNNAHPTRKDAPPLRIDANRGKASNFQPQRRLLLIGGAVLAGGSLLGGANLLLGENAGSSLSSAALAQTPLTLPELKYPLDALQPFMSKETLEYHHGKHHQAVITAANKIMEETGITAPSLETLVVQAKAKNQALLNNVGQHYNHLHFWSWMKPKGGGALPGSLEKIVIRDFGSVDAMKAEFIKAGMGQFGSGWCWLAFKEGKLKVYKTPNGENPLLDNAFPVLGCDVWEHSYYIDYRNRRADYLKAFVENLVNWEYVDERLSLAMKAMP